MSTRSDVSSLTMSALPPSDKIDMRFLNFFKSFQTEQHKDMKYSNYLQSEQWNIHWLTLEFSDPGIRKRYQYFSVIQQSISTVVLCIVLLTTFFNSRIVAGVWATISENKDKLYAEHIAIIIAGLDSHKLK